MLNPSLIMAFSTKVRRKIPLGLFLTLIGFVGPFILSLSFFRGSQNNKKIKIIMQRHLPIL